MTDMADDAILKADMPDNILEYFSDFYANRSFHYSDKSRMWHALRVALQQRNDLLYMLNDVDIKAILMACDELPDTALPRSIYLRRMTNKIQKLLDGIEDVLKPEGDVDDDS